MKEARAKIPGTVSNNGRDTGTSMVVFVTYLRQRFSIATFCALAIFLLVYSKGDFTFATVDVVSFAAILLFLLALRLYDDLQNVRHDEHKPNRIYTDPGAARTLYWFFAGVSLLVSGLLISVNMTSGIAFVGFLLANHGLYLLFINRSLRYFLPLLKYPFLAGLMSVSWSAGSAALFFAFLTFDLIDDPAFPLPRWSSIITSLAAFALLLPATSQPRYVVIASLAIAAAAVSLGRTRYAAYAFLILILLARLIDPLYEI